MRKAIEVLEGQVSCNCDPAYKDRGLVAPDCPLHAMEQCYIDAMKEYAREVATQFADKILNDYTEDVISSQDDTLVWRLCGTEQKYTSEELYEALEKENVI